MKILALLLLLLFTGCHPKSRTFEPLITYTPNQRCIQNLPSAFPPVQNTNEWTKEMVLGGAFAKELDLYRAITCYKRALHLMPRYAGDQRLQAEYAIACCYYLGRRFPDFLETVEFGPLFNIPENFPAFNDLSLMLYDAYEQTEQPEKACKIKEMIRHYNPGIATNLDLYSDLKMGNCSGATSDSMLPYLATYHRDKKSVSKAQWLNALLPGAGYYYVGQRKSAITSFLLNALFLAATYQFAEKRYIPAAIITGSFELGWYLGGINGAGLAAKEYNERLYELQVKELMIHHRLFPVLMLQTVF